MIAVTRRRPELGLLFWVAALGITGSVAVAAAEVAGFRPQQLVIPVTFVVIAFVGSHRVDDGFDAVDLFFVHIVGGFLHAGERADRRQHPNDAFQRTHLLHLPQLVAEVFEREAVAA